MSLARGDRGGGSGSGLLFGTGTSIFADNAARNTYFTANPDSWINTTRTSSC